MTTNAPYSHPSGCSCARSWASATFTRGPIFCIAVVLLTLFSHPSLAGEADRYDRVSFSLSEQTDVDADVVVATLYVQREGDRQSQLADDINRVMSWALQTTSQFSDIEVATQDYRTDPVYQNNRIAGWRARQSLEIRSASADVISDVLGRLQEKLAVSGISYETTPALRRSVEAELTDRVLAAVQSRAERIATAMGRVSYRVVRIDINANGNRPPVAYRSSPMVAAEAVAPPALTGGDQTLTVNANVEIELSPAALQ